MKITKLAISLFVLGLCAPLFTFAAPSLDSIPDAVKSKYTFNGSIAAVVSDGTTLYIGGGFTTITLNPLGDPTEYTRNYLAAIDLSTYTLTSFDPNLNSSVTSLALSSDGSTLYVGGSFYCVGGEFEFNCLESERYNLAAIDTSTGNATAFNPDTDGEVNTLALSADDSLLFAGGTFTNVNTTGISLPRNNLAAFTTADGIATDFDPNIDNTANAIVLSLDELTLYVAGNFTTVNGVIPQESLAAFDVDTGDVQNFYSSFLGVSRALALSSDGNTLYVGGDMTAYNSQRGEGVLFDEATEEPIDTVKIATVGGGGGGGGGATVYTSIPDGNGGWYIGGSFTHVGTTSQPRLAHITSSGVFDGAFNPDVDNGAVYDLELFGTTLYAGGQFSSVEGDMSKEYVAAFNTTDGSVTAFSPYPDATVHDIELSSDGETLYIGGEFYAFGPDFITNYRSAVAAFDTTGAGTMLAFNPDILGSVYTLALTDDDSTLYVGGSFNDVKYGDGIGGDLPDPITRNNIAAFSTAADGALLAFDPNANGDVRALKLNGLETSLYAGGAFTTIGGQSRFEFAELDTSDGTATALDAQIAGQIETVFTIELSSDESTIYIGGESFSQIGEQFRTYFGEIDAVTGLATSFNPEFDGSVQTIVSSGSGEIFIGGSFFVFGGLGNVDNIAAIDVATDSLDPVFSSTTFDNSIYTLALSSDDALLYVGGDFLDINSGTSRDYLAAFDTTDGTATVFDPVGTLHVYGLGLATDDTELYVGSYDADDTGTSELLIFDAGDVVVDETAPVITLLGSTPVEITVGGVYVDAGATAEDDVDGDITADIVTVNPVDTNTVGTYTITYNVEDTAGNPAVEVTRTVNVIVDLNVDEDDDDGGGGGSGSRATINRSTSGYNLEHLLAKLLGLLQQYLALLIEEQQQ